MKTFAKIVGLLLATAALIAAVLGLVVFLYNQAYPTYSWNQKLTVEVQTPDGIVTGSSVTHIEWSRSLFGDLWLDASSWVSKVQGEAVVVDLGDGKYLFALMRTPENYEYTSELATRTLYDTTERRWGKEAFRAVTKLKKPMFVPQNLYSLLVTFTDINDPTTVNRVEPNDLTSTFGSGYSLKGITMEITDEPVTKWRVEKMLVWLTWANEKFLKHGGGTNPLKMPNDSPRGYITLGRTYFRERN